MKKTFLFYLSLIISAGSIQAQYLETFDVPNKGILAGPCGNNAPSSCASSDFAGVNWTLEGDLSGLVAADDNFFTEGGVLRTRDIDEEICWLSPVLDITGTASFTMDLTWLSFDDYNGAAVGSKDYIDVSYRLNGGSWVILPNAVGGGPHTVAYVTGTGDNSGSFTGLGVSGLTGSTLQIRVCADANATLETVTIDNVAAVNADLPGSGPTCDLVLGGTNTTNEDCPGASDGSITVNATTSNGPIVFTLSGPVNESNQTGVFANLPPGNYSVALQDGSFAPGNCTASTGTINIAVGTDATGPTGTPPGPITVDCPEDIPVPNPGLVTNIDDNCMLDCVTEPWINEFHYDNIGTDINEFIEIAGPAGIDLSAYTLFVYDGFNGQFYNSFALSGVIPDEDNGFGTGFVITPNLQNTTEAIALVKNGNQVIEFISYEGVVTATDGPANGLTSVDIGISESNDTTPSNGSLGRVGNGNKPGDFSWAALTQTQGSLNTGQSITDCPDNEPTVVHLSDTDNGGAASAGNPYIVTRTYRITDAAGNTTDVTQTLTANNCCDITITDVTTTDEICPDANDGTITVTATCASCTGGDADIRYSIDNVDFTNITGVFTGLADDSYTVYVQDVNDITCADSDGTYSINAGVDDEAPTNVTCQDVTINLPANGVFPLSVNYVVDNILTSFEDNCAASPLTIGVGAPFIVEYTCANIGTFPATFAYKDGNGNETLCTSNITVLDPLNLCCAIEITDVSTNDVGCPAADDGTITVSATCASCANGDSDIRYSIDNVNFTNTTGVFTGLADGSYTVYVQDVNDGSCSDSDGPYTISAGVDVIAPTISCGAGTTGNMLLNNSFEIATVHDQQGATDWASFGFVFALDENIFPSAQDGNFFLKMFGVNSGVFQDHPVNPGDEHTASVYARNASFDPILPGCQGFIKLEYYNGGGDLISVTQSSSVDNTLPLNVWTQITLDDTAPAGAATVRMVVMMQCTAGGAVMFDNASLGTIVSVEDIVVNVACPSEIPAPDVNSIVASDNCGTLLITHEGDVSDGGFNPETITRTYRATDDLGNFSECTQTFIVEDNISPVAICPTTSPTVVLDQFGNGTLPANALAGGNSTDNCSSVTETSPEMTFTCSDAPSVMVELTATDASGNISTVMCTVIIDNSNCITPPANNDCANAEVVSVGVHPFSTINASGTDITSCTTADNIDVWFEWEAPADGIASFSTCADADFDTSLGIFDACGGNELACNDDSSLCPGLTSLISNFEVVGGTTYFVRVAGFDNAFGSGNLTISLVPAAANNDCANAEVVSVGVHPFSTINASGTDLTSCANNDNIDVWFAWEAPADGLASFSTCDDADFDTTLGIFDGCGGSELECNDDSSPSSLCPGYTSLISGFEVTEGTTYFVRIAGFGLQTGSGNLTISFDTNPSNNDCVDAQNLNASVWPAANNSLGTLFGATNESGVTCTGNADGGDVYYEFTVTEENHFWVNVNPIGGADVAFEVVDDGCGETFFTYACVDAGSGGDAEFAFMENLTPGTYTVRVFSGNIAGSPAAGNFLINVQSFPKAKVQDSPTHPLFACGSTDRQLEDIVGAMPQSGQQPGILDYRWRVVRQGGGYDIEWTRGGPNYATILSWLGMDYNETYDVYVRMLIQVPNVGPVWGVYGEVCTIATSNSITQTKVRDEFASPLAGAYAMCDVAVAETVADAEDYEWEFDNGVDSPVYYQRGVGNPSVKLSWVDCLKPNTIYQVRVRATVGGVPGPWGPAEGMEFGPTATTQLRPTLCGETFELNNWLLPTNVCTSSSFEWQLINTATSDVHVITTTNAVGAARPAWAVPALVPGAEYSVSVKAFQCGEGGDFGAACNITIAGPTAPGDETPMLRDLSATTASLFPNPNAGDKVRLELDGLNDDNHEVMIQIYDIYGKLIQTDGFGHQGRRLSRLVSFDSELAMGMYMVQIVVDGERFATERLVIK